MKIIWFVSSLESKGGGERFVLESVKALKVLGHQVAIVCDRLEDGASFDGRYDLSEVICLERSLDASKTYVSIALNKFRGIFSLLKIAQRFKPDLIICQSEFDAIKVKFVASKLKCRYRVFVFGQMFQFKTDISKYSSVFRQHLDAILKSRPGYSQTVIMPPPRLSLVTYVVNEIVSRVKLSAIRNADKVFVLSNQVKWEVSLLYGSGSTIIRAAIDDSYIDVAALSSTRAIKNPVQFLSICRLVEKKRVALIIRAFEVAQLDANLIIVGNGPELDSLQYLAKNSTASSRIHFLGAIDDAQLANELANADCFISMDIGDFDITVVEALGKGCRVIVSNDFDLSTFGENLDGVISVMPDTTALADALSSIYSMQAPSLNNLDSLRQLTWQNLAFFCVLD